jgi:hypothetical protein
VALPGSPGFITIVTKHRSILSADTTLPDFQPPTPLPFVSAPSLPSSSLEGFSGPRAYRCFNDFFHDLIPFFEVFPSRLIRSSSRDGCFHRLGTFAFGLPVLPDVHCVQLTRYWDLENLDRPLVLTCYRLVWRPNFFPSFFSSFFLPQSADCIYLPP